MTPFFSYEQCRAMNYRFALAMLAARKSGKEKFTLGAIKDDSPLVPAHFARGYEGSLFGSAAQFCVEEMPSRAGMSAAPARLGK